MLFGTLRCVPLHCHCSCWSGNQEGLGTCLNFMIPRNSSHPRTVEESGLLLPGISWKSSATAFYLSICSRRFLVFWGSQKFCSVVPVRGPRRDCGRACSLFLLFGFLRGAPHLVLPARKHGVMHPRFLEFSGKPPLSSLQESKPWVLVFPRSQKILPR